MPTGLPTRLHLPDFLASWPYERRLNPHYLKVSKAAYAWISSYRLLTAKSQRAFELCNSGLLAALAYPEASDAHLRVVCDALNIVFLFDDYSDVQDTQTVREVADNIVAAMRNPHTPPNPHVKDHSRFGEITRSFWSRALQTLSPSCAHRFIAAFCAYSTAVVQQAQDRSQEHVRDVASYLVLRRETIGAKLAFALLDGIEGGVECESGISNDPRLVELESAAIDIISLSNDVYSYDVEQSRDDDAHNMLTCIRRSYNLSLQDATTKLERHVLALEKRFLDLRTHGWTGSDAVNAPLLAYIDGIGNWVRANDAWSFESQRYFGPEGMDIQTRRVVQLRPKRPSS